MRGRGGVGQELLDGGDDCGSLGVGGRAAESSILGRGGRRLPFWRPSPLNLTWTAGGGRGLRREAVLAAVRPPRRSSALARRSSATRAATGRCRRRSTSMRRPTATSGRCPHAATASRPQVGDLLPGNSGAGCRSSPARCSSRAPRPASCWRSRLRRDHRRCAPGRPPPSRRSRWPATTPQRWA